MPNLICPHCRATIAEPPNIDQTWMIACQSCGTPRFLWNGTYYQNLPKPMLGLIPHVRTGQTREGVAIRYRRMGCMASLLLSVVWLFLLVGALSDQNPWAIHLGLIAACVALGYVLAEEIFNRRIILLGAKEIRISDEPMPPLRNLILHNPIVCKIVPRFAERDFSLKHVIRISDIEQIYCAERIESDGESGSQTFFDVQIGKSDGSDILLVKGLKTHEEALFIQMGIKQLYHVETSPNPALGIFDFRN